VGPGGFKGPIRLILMTVSSSFKWALKDNWYLRLKAGSFYLSSTLQALAELRLASLGLGVSYLPGYASEATKLGLLVHLFRLLIFFLFFFRFFKWVWGIQRSIRFLLVTSISNLKLKAGVSPV
jgi:hypothetical protein